MKTFLEYAEIAEDRLWVYKCPQCDGNALNGDPKTGARYRGGAKCQECGNIFSAITQTPINKNGPSLSEAVKCVCCQAPINLKKDRSAYYLNNKKQKKYGCHNCNQTGKFDQHIDQIAKEENNG